MKTLLRLLRFPRSADLIELNAPKRLDANMLELVPLLEASLTKDVLSISLRRVKSAAVKTWIFYSIFAVSCIWLAFIIPAGFLVFIAEEYKQEELSGWVFAIMIGSCLFIAILSKKLVNRVARATLNPLHSIVQKFETRQMVERWEHFFGWAKANNLVIYFKLASSEYIAVPVEIWKKDFVVVFIFGSKRHRGYLVHSSHDYLESVVISAEDWELYEKTLPQVDLKEAPTSQIDKVDNDYKLNRPAPSFSKVTSLAKAKPAASKTGSKRTTHPKKVEKPHSRKCPRFEMMCKEKKYLTKYKDKEIKEHTLNRHEKPAHNVLLVMLKYFDDLELFFSKDKMNDEQQKKLATLREAIEKALEVKGGRMETRYSDFKNKGWRRLEEYIKQHNIISDAKIQ